MFYDLDILENIFIYIHIYKESFVLAYTCQLITQKRDVIEHQNHPYTLICL